MTTGDRAAAIDLGALAIVVAGALAFSQRLPVISALVGVVIVGRFVALSLLARDRPLLAELILFLLCALVGGLNDWNTVVRHGVYVYTVPADLPSLSSIPTWMLLVWGLVLRALARLASWRRLGPAGEGSTPRPLATWRLAVLLALVAATRQSIYRLAHDPLLSWAPFAAALVIALVVGWPAVRARRLALLALAVGPVAEALLIRVAHLHAYALGWLFGVPIWIVLWWSLGVLVWGDVAPRLERAIGAVVIESS